LVGEYFDDRDAVEGEYLPVSPIDRQTARGRWGSPDKFMLSGKQMIAIDTQ
jgi:hypothetical protein